MDKKEAKTLPPVRVACETSTTWFFLSIRWVSPNASHLTTSCLVRDLYSSLNVHVMTIDSLILIYTTGSKYVPNYFFKY